MHGCKFPSTLVTCCKSTAPSCTVLPYPSPCLYCTLRKHLINVRGTPEAHSNDLECPVAVKFTFNTYLFWPKFKNRNVASEAKKKWKTISSPLIYVFFNFNQRAIKYFLCVKKTFYKGCTISNLACWIFNSSTVLRMFVNIEDKSNNLVPLAFARF